MCWRFILLSRKILWHYVCLSLRIPVWYLMFVLFLYLCKQISMFKRNYDHLPKDTYFGMYKDATRGNPNYFLTYGNGKSAARIQDHLRPNGAHRWHNYMKTPKYVNFILEEKKISIMTLTIFIIGFLMSILYACNGYY